MIEAYDKAINHNILGAISSLSFRYNLNSMDLSIKIMRLTLRSQDRTELEASQRQSLDHNHKSP